MTLNQVIKLFFSFFVCVVLMQTLQGNVRAEEYQTSNAMDKTSPWETFSLDFGYFVSDINTDLKFGLNSRSTTINVEDLLNLDSTSNVFRIRGAWRFTKNKKHKLGFQWFSINRDGENILDETIELENSDGELITIPAGTGVYSNFDIDLYNLAYSYSFIQNDRMDFSGSLGAYIMPINFGLKSEGFIDFDETQSFTAPLPVIGLRADFAIAPKWYLLSGINLFYLELSDFKGHIIQADINLEYRPWKHVGIGAGFDYFQVNVENNGDSDYPEIDLRGEIDFKYTGLILYTKLYF